MGRDHLRASHGNPAHCLDLHDLLFFSGHREPPVLRHRRKRMPANRSYPQGPGSAARASPDLELRIENRPSAGALEVAPEREGAGAAQECARAQPDRGFLAIDRHVPEARVTGKTRDELRDPSVRQGRDKRDAAIRRHVGDPYRNLVGSIRHTAVVALVLRRLSSQRLRRGMRQWEPRWSTKSTHIWASRPPTSSRGRKPSSGIRARRPSTSSRSRRCRASSASRWCRWCRSSGYRGDATRWATSWWSWDLSAPTRA